MRGGAILFVGETCQFIFKLSHPLPDVSITVAGSIGIRTCITGSVVHLTRPFGIAPGVESPGALMPPSDLFPACRRFRRTSRADIAGSHFRRFCLIRIFDLTIAPDRTAPLEAPVSPL